MTKTEAFEANLSTSADVTVLRGKFVFSAVNSVTAGLPTIQFVLNPTGAGNFGLRASALASVFSRYRFKYLRIKFLEQLTTGTICAVGIQDDVSITANNPTTVSGVSELRCSGSAFSQQTIPTQFEWQPADKNYWYYTTNDLTDGRLSSSGNIWTASQAASGVVNMEIDYCIVFKGATDNGSL